MTGIGESTVIKIVDEVCQVIVENMWHDSVEKYFPKSKEEFLVKMQEMESQWQFEYAFSAIDCSHLPIKRPPGGAQAIKEYHNFKNFYSVILLALVDAKYRFIWASLSAPKNAHDSTLFQSTSLWSNIVSGDVLSEAAAKTNDDIVIPPLIVGDGAFPMRSFLLKPYGDAVLSDKKNILITEQIGGEWLLRVLWEN